MKIHGNNGQKTIRKTVYATLNFEISFKKIQNYCYFYKLDVIFYKSLKINLIILQWWNLH